MQQQQQQDRQLSLDACKHCGGRGYRNHPREHCPARDVECGKTGHYRRVCKSKGRPGSPKEGGDAMANSVQVAEVRDRGGSDPTPMMLLQDPIQPGGIPDESGARGYNSVSKMRERRRW